MRAETLLFRQVNPAWVQSGRVTSQVFKPTPKDRKRLSVYDGDQVGAEASWRHYTEQLGFSSVGVLAVTVGESESLELSAVPDAEPFPAHAVIDFEACSNTQIEKHAKQLRQFAEARGWQYRNEVSA